MKRKDFVKTLGLGATVLSTQPLTLFAQQQQKYQFKEITNGIGYFTSQGGTIGWFADGDKKVIIDSQFPNTVEFLINELKLSNTSKATILWNTHHHGDHTSGNITLQPFVNRIVAHKNVPRLQHKQAESQGKIDAQTFASETYTDRYTVDLGKEKLSGFYLGAAHTNGDSILHFENSNIAHLGDLVFNNVYPYMDVTMGEGSIVNWVKVLDQVIKYFDTDTQFIFGHGTSITGTLDDVKRKRDYLDTLVDKVKTAVDNNFTKEQVLAIAEFDSTRKPMWDGAFRMNLEAVYRELNR